MTPMRAGRAETWRQICRADFEAVHFSEQGAVSRHGPLRIVRWGKAESRRKVGVGGWHDLLAKLRTPFGDGLEEASIHFDDLEPVVGAVPRRGEHGPHRLGHATLAADDATAVFGRRLQLEYRQEGDEDLQTGGGG